MNPTNQFSDLLALMARLRTDCPWDKKQTNDSLQKYAIEEVFELIEAISNDDKSPLATDDIKGELGDVLFVLTNLARHLDIDAEMALQNTNAKFKRRFAFVEQSFMEQGKTFEESDLAEMDKYWDMAKDAENK